MPEIFYDDKKVCYNKFREPKINVMNNLIKTKKIQGAIVGTKLID